MDRNLLLSLSDGSLVSVDDHGYFLFSGYVWYFLSVTTYSYEFCDRLHVILIWSWEQVMIIKGQIPF